MTDPVFKAVEANGKVYPYVAPAKPKRAAEPGPLTEKQFNRISKGWVKRHELLVRFVAERDGWNCALCGGRVMPEGKNTDLHPSIDHTVPLSRGGLNVPGNVRLTHRKCNLDKGARLIEEIVMPGDGPRN